MSKGSLFWANASGKLGETVLYRSGGEQRTRTYVAKIKNPKTLAQMQNRLSMRNFAGVYRSLKGILSVSFPNRAAKESGFNAFVKVNKSINTPVVTKEGALAGLSVPYNMLLSQGYLTQFGEFKHQTINQTTRGMFNLSGHPNYGEIRSYYSQNMKESTINSLENLTALYNKLQLPQNANITIVTAEYADEGFAVSSQTINLKSSDQVLSSMERPLVIGGSDSLDDDVVMTLMLKGSGSGEVMNSIIISWTDASGKLQVTNSRMCVFSDNLEFAEQFVKGGDVYEQVLQQYGYNEGATL